ncbi:MAG: M6 family metalloprotease domain-containing protein, partial [Chloroflexi bacterium]|nr:M6 family metalloprotease domain-containing protein [Chloroflexota bacterium]
MHARKGMRILGLLMTVAMLLSLAGPAMAAPPAPDSDTSTPGLALGGGALRPHEKPLTLTPDYKPARLNRGPDPAAYRRLMQAERQALASGTSPQSLGFGFQGDANVLYILVEFTGTQTFDVLDPDTCEATGETVTIAGPLHNMIPPPGPRDNNTFWTDDFSADLYRKLLFDDASGGIGVVRTDLNSGAGVDLSGKTFRAYYEEISEGQYSPGGTVIGWVQVPVSEGEYGADSCIPGVGLDEGSDNRNGPVYRVVADALDAFRAANPDFDWTQFDQNGDGYVDTIQFIHAGMGQEAGGGAQGTFSIWSHSWGVNPPGGYVVDPVNDVRVFRYGINPENLDVGVAAEEFGHATFGLPDIYDYTGFSNSNAFWYIMSGGSWNGELGGMEPAPFPLWFRWLAGWIGDDDMAVFDLESEEAWVKLGQREVTPEGTLEGFRFDLPPTVSTVDNPMGSGQAWWGGEGNYIENTLIQQFDLTTATAPVVFSFDSAWDIETDWDYGFVGVSTDDGATWTYIQDLSGFFTDTSPNGQNKGWGLTGPGNGRLEFDLSPYVGGTVWVRVEYWTDAAVNEAGWFVDNFSLDDATGNLFADDVEAGADGWTADGWVLVPFLVESPHYYLGEWVNHSGFDHGLQYAYQTVYSDDDEWEVDRLPYNVPGLLVAYRDTRWSTQYPGDEYASPSFGYKQGHLVVDAHPWPWSWDSDGAALSGRVQGAD